MTGEDSMQLVEKRSSGNRSGAINYMAVPRKKSEIACNLSMKKAIRSMQ